MKPPYIILNPLHTLPAGFFKLQIVWLVFECVTFGNVQAQTSKQFKVKAGEEASAVIPFQDRYRFPEFREGKVMYTHGTSATIRLNYNLLLGEMQFISPKADTATLVNEYALKRVQMGQSLFYNDYRQGYVEVITSYPGIKLGIKQVFHQIRTENVGDNGYGVSPGQSTKVTSLRDPNTSQKILVDRVLTKKASYFVIDRNERIYKASKASFMKIGKSYKKEIARYLEEESIDFNKEADLQKLVAFFSQLGQ